MEMLLQERSMFMMLEEVGYELVRFARKACRQFHQHCAHAFFVRMSFRQLFPRTCNVHVTRKKPAVQKMRAYKVDEIHLERVMAEIDVQM